MAHISRCRTPLKAAVVVSGSKYRPFKRFRLRIASESMRKFADGRRPASIDATSFLFHFQLGSKPLRRLAGDFFERAIKLRQRPKTTLKSNVGHAQPRVLQQIFGLLDAYASQICDKRQPGRLFKQFAEVAALKFTAAATLLSDRS